MAILNMPFDTYNTTGTKDYSTSELLERLMAQLGKIDLNVLVEIIQVVDVTALMAQTIGFPYQQVQKLIVHLNQANHSQLNYGSR